MFILNTKDNKTLYQRLYDAITSDILTGKLRAGDKLPPSRSLSKELNISRNTVNRTYQQLLSEGYIISKAGNGMFINQIETDMIPEVSKSKIIKDTIVEKYKYDFSYGAANGDMFPFLLWKKSLNNAFAAIQSYQNLEYPNRQGELVLRQEISRYLYTSRGVRCNPNQIVITAGHQYSMEIIATMFQKGLKRLAIEEPGYDGIKSVFLNHDYSLLPVEVMENGINLDRLRNQKANLLYLTPSHQFPTGSVLPIDKRLNLLDWANKSDCYLIEDDYDSELRFYESPIPSMQSLDGNERVIYTGTISKCLSPILRIAYVVFPPSLMELYSEHFGRYNSQVSTLNQLALADFIASGNFQKQINKLRTYYRKQQKSMIDSLYSVFGKDITIFGEGAGLHILVDFKLSCLSDQLIQSAAKAEIKLYSPRAQFINENACPCSLLLFGYATIPSGKFLKIFSQLKEQWVKDQLI